jgi:preprotein translocase subunit YajC
MDPFFLILVFGALLLLWLMSSRTRKQQQMAARFRESLAPGQEVMTGSGLFGTIVDVEDDIVTLETSPGVTSRWLRPAIAKLVDPPVVEDDVYTDEDDLTP